MIARKHGSQTRKAGSVAPTLSVDTRLNVTIEHGRDSSSAAERFAKFQKDVLEGCFADEPNTLQLIASLILFDGIVTPADLEHAFFACDSRYVWRDTLAVEWTRPTGHQDRRLLSAVTSRHLVEPSPKFCRAEFGESLQKIARSFLPGAADPVVALFDHAVAWSCRVLPSYLIGHISGFVPFTALPRSALIREATHQVDQRAAMGTPTLSPTIGRALDSYFLASSGSGSDWLVDQILETCCRTQGENEVKERARMLGECRGAATRAEQADAISSAILAWTIYLIECGTPHKQPVKLATVRKYLRLVVRPLRHAFLGSELSTRTVDDYHRIYVEVIDAASPGERGNCRSAIHAWHAFGVEFLSMPPLTSPICVALEMPVPQAEIVWPHEIERIESWLDSSELTERMIHQIRLALTLATHVRLRSHELLHLRLRNFVDRGDLIEIEIVPTVQDGPLKSESAKRIQSIDDPAALCRIRKWLARRRLEQALHTDLIFGDPFHPRHIHQEGQFRMLLSTLLKHATGSQDVSIHTLSHTWVSERVSGALSAAVGSNVNPLHLIATEAGHLDPSTTLFHYFHLYEGELRKQLDQVMREIPLTSKEASALCGITDTALRKRASIKGSPLQSVCWDAVLLQKVDANAPALEDVVGIGPPPPPELPGRNRDLSFEMTCRILEDLVGGLDFDAIASRSGVEGQLIGTISIAAKRQLIRLRTTHSFADRRTPADRWTDAERAGGLRLPDEFCAGSARGGKFNQPHAFLARGVERHRMEKFVGAWEGMFDHGFLSLHDITRARQLLQMLKEAGVSGTRLAIVLPSNESNVHAMAARTHEVELNVTFIAVFGFAPLTVRQKKRRGRPECHLVWSSTAVHDAPEIRSAAVSLKGFHFLMLAAAVFMRVGETAVSGSLPLALENSNVG